MVLIQKWPFFQLPFFGNIGQKNVFYNILERKKAFLGFKNEKFKKLKIGIFTKRLTNGFGPKMAVCPTFFFQAKQARENVFYDILERKNAFLRKKKSSKSRRIAIFLKGLIRGFWTKMTFLATFFFQAKQARKMCFAIFQNEKTPFWAIKTRSSKSQRIAISPKGLAHGFGTKMAMFLFFFFFQNRP